MKVPLDKYLPQTALVADDEPTVRMLARTALEEAGFLVEEAEDGAGAVEAIERSLPDLVLLDASLPGIDGFGVCSRVRSLAGDRPCAVVMMTEVDQHDSIGKAYQLGATDFLTKPVNWELLGYRARCIARENLAARDLRFRQARLEYAQQVARLASWEWVVEEDLFVFSELMNEIFAISPVRHTGTLENFLELIHPLEKEYVRSVFLETARKEAPSSIDARIIDCQGGESFVHIEVGIIDAGGENRRLSGTVQDITQRKVSENEIRSLAYYDVLTGLANRLQFNDCLQSALTCALSSGRKVALIFLDLDRFKCINDTLGHEAGDLLLKQVASRLKHCLRKGDCVSREGSDKRSETVSRLGGDEFTIVLDNIASDQDAAKVARRIIRDLAKPVELLGREVMVTASLGISLFPDDGADALTLINSADSAMYHAKSLGANNFQFYSRSMNDTALERLAMEGALRKALERDEFLLFYQPQIDTATGALVAVEALVRWRHPEKGVVPPSLFIALAEESGLITAIDLWVMSTVCRQIRSWKEEGLDPIRVAVNLSGRDFAQNKVLAMVQESLQGSGIDPRFLELDITEAVLMKNAHETVQTLQALKSMGLKLSIDDFGTGYSSLSYLQRFPLDMLKIDRSFVSDVTTNSGNAAIVSAIIALASSLSLSVLAEGVETDEQRSFLEGRGCSMMQGYLFSNPVAAEGISAMLGGGCV